MIINVQMYIFVFSKTVIYLYVETTKLRNKKRFVDK